MRKKLYVLDSSVLIHDPKSLEQFEDNIIGIPYEVLEELDKIKSESSLRGKSARQAQRELLKALGDQNHENKLKSGGTIKLLIPKEEDLKGHSSKIISINRGYNNSDNRILLTTLWAKESHANTQTILVTKDIGMQLKARLCQISVEDYKFDKSPDETHTTTELKLEQIEFEKFATEKEIELEIKDEPDLNSYGLFCSEQKIPWRYIGKNKFVKVESINEIQINSGPKIKPRSLEQLFLLDALLNPNIDLVTVKGIAGTGKTLLTMASCLHMIEKRIYSGVCIAKPNESVGRGNGYLPGSLEEKLEPWLQPYSDAINFLHHPPRHPLGLKFTESPKQTKSGRTPYDDLKEKGLVEITAIEYIRGRSIPNKLFVLDEVQNVPQPVLKTIASRLGEGSKLICLGDTEQVDNPYLDSQSNGLTHIRNAMKNLHNAAHLTLVKGERSMLAQQAAELL